MTPKSFLLVCWLPWCTQACNVNRYGNCCNKTQLMCFCNGLLDFKIFLIIRAVCRSFAHQRSWGRGIILCLANGHSSLSHTHSLMCSAETNSTFAQNILTHWPTACLCVCVTSVYFYNWILYFIYTSHKALVSGVGYRTCSEAKAIIFLIH